MRVAVATQIPTEGMITINSENERDNDESVRPVESVPEEPVSKQSSNEKVDAKTLPVITDETQLLRYGVSRARIPTGQIPLHKWATELSQITPLITTSEADGEYAFYRNILDEPDFPFDAVLNSEIGTAIKKYFGINNLKEEIRLDDAFCIHYNMSQDDTTCAKHTDPSDITVNMCLEKSRDVVGSQVVFYGVQKLQNIDVDEDEVNGSTKDANMNEENVEKTKVSEEQEEVEDKNFQFQVDQEEGYATIHWGHHPHMTTPLKKGKRTNIVITYCFADSSRSDVALRTCYCTS